MTGGAVMVRVESWLHRSPVSARDLSIYRILFALVSLFGSAQTREIRNYPEAWFDPPPGPIQLFPSLPSDGVLTLIEVAYVLAILTLLAGYKTPAASVAVSVLFFTLSGLEFSYGKIDHTVLSGIVPLVLATSGWGMCYSLDSKRRHTSVAGECRETIRPTWQPRVLGLAVGLTVLTSALMKVAPGLGVGSWLDPTNQASRGHFLRYYHASDLARTEYLAPVAAAIDVPLLWELADWATVVVEGSLIIALVSWAWYRRALAAMTLFHLGVLLVFNISFAENLLAYAAFISWSRPAKLTSAFERNGRFAVFAIGAVAAISLGLRVFDTDGVTEGVLAEGLVLAAGIFAAVFLMSQIRGGLRTARRRSST